MPEDQIIKYAIGAGFALVCLAIYVGIDLFVRAKPARSQSIMVHVAQVAVLWALVLVLKEILLMVVAAYQLVWLSERMVQFVATVAITAIIARQLFMLINRLEKKQVQHGADRTSSRVVARVLKVTIVFFMLLFFGERLGVSFSGLLAFGGIGGIAIGLASKDILSNVFSGIMLYFDRPFSIGDWISSPDRNIEGTVEEVGWRLTRITTFDNRPLYVPNSLFSSISVENPGRMTNRRISTEIGLRYEDADKVGAVVDDIRAMLKANGKIDTSQSLLVYFNDFADSSLTIMVYCFTKTTVWAEWLAAQQEVYLSIVEIVHRHGADFAFPSRTLYMEKDGA